MLLTFAMLSWLRNASVSTSKNTLVANHNPSELSSGASLAPDLDMGSVVFSNVLTKHNS